jgi:hypothetical protein
VAAKLALTRRLYRQGRTRQEIIRLYRLIDWLLQLPDDLEDGVWRAIQAYEEEQQVTYITSAERFMRRDAVAQGRAEGLQEAIATALETRFEESGKALLLPVRQITDPQRLRAILVLALTGGLDDIRAAIGEGEQAQ